MKYKEQYEQFHNDGKFAGGTIVYYANMIRAFCRFYDVNTALDYGCGKATPYKFEQPLSEFIGVDVDLYDPFVPEHNTLDKRKNYDAIWSIDVLEHIPEDEIEHVLSYIYDHAKKLVFLSFCNRDAKKTFPDGTNVHVLQRSRVWWEDKLQEINKKQIPTILIETQ